MSEEGCNDKPAKRTPPPRLASVLSNHSANSSQTTVSSVREMTLGGVQKAKFAPVVNARKAKVEPSADASGEANGETLGADTKRKGAHRPVRGRGRGRGGASEGPGRGLLSDRRGPSGPAAISGPFSLGPSSSAKSKQTAAPIQVGFAGGISNRGGSSGQGRSFGRANAAGYSSVNFTDEDEIVDLEKIISMESLELGEDHCPVHIAAPSPSNDLVKSPETIADIIADNQQILLIQMPSELPKLENTRVSIDEGENAEEAPQPSEQWPAEAEGEYGSLAVHASGRVSLTINGIRYFLESGSSAVVEQGHVAGCQSVVAIDPEYEQSFELGQIKSALIASLDISSILQQQQQ